MAKRTKRDTLEEHTVIREDIAVLKTEMQAQTKSLQKIEDYLKIQNGRISKNEEKIGLLNQFKSKIIGALIIITFLIGAGMLKVTGVL